MKKYLFIVLLVGVWSCGNDEEKSFLDLQYIQLIDETECGGGYEAFKTYKRNDCIPCDYDSSPAENIFCIYEMNGCVDIHFYEDEGFFVCHPRDGITIPDSILQDTMYIDGYTIHAYKER